MYILLVNPLLDKISWEDKHEKQSVLFYIQSVIYIGLRHFTM